ncbi:WD40-repeat-containing domain protein [Kockovaella imperatae]|uniref:Pre-mRNA-splicing factor PRP46 n=1 Tax=Kockovaella imperatae TaxID=4999 RepID=A0A1Y1UI42_9TREE|nr:WD40-repeat-containing domain protein [Kockovaella imperatae]ORX37733.1 WD40-repeat-containing domain protein [Kockovaella imperatae]
MTTLAQPSPIAVMDEAGPSTSSTIGLTPLAELVQRSVKRSRAVYSAQDSTTDHGLDEATRIKLATKLAAEFKDVQTLPPVLAAQQAGPAGPKRPAQPAANGGGAGPGVKLIGGPETASSSTSGSAAAAAEPRLLVKFRHQQGFAAEGGHSGSRLSQALMRKKEAREVKPVYHPQWKLTRVISGHMGWVRAVTVDPDNQWFATGAGDRVVKIWDLASGELKLSLTGHISTIRGLGVSDRHPYLFSCAEDKMVKCWDLETNKVIRHYHGHFSGVYSLAVHPTLDVLCTAGRDASVRVWDMRTRANIFTLTGHQSTVADVKTQDSDPQIISGSMDSTVRLWDLAAGKCMTTLTHHKKSVRALAIHPTEYSFASASSGGNNIKKWKCPEGIFVNNFVGHEAIINTLSLNTEGVMFSGADNGTLTMWDYATGLPFQHLKDIPQPGSLDAEAGVFCSTFDKTGTRLITGGADKTIKVYSEQA